MFDQALRNNDPIKRVSVMKFQGKYSLKVFEGYRQDIYVIVREKVDDPVKVGF